jgi:type I restriction enzyme S subunit
LGERTEKIVNQFYEILENIQEKKQTALAENQQLSSLRDWLLPMLMNGQVRVGSGAERNAGYDMEEGKWVVEPK